MTYAHKSETERNRNSGSIPNHSVLPFTVHTYIGIPNQCQCVLKRPITQPHNSVASLYDSTAFFITFNRNLPASWYHITVRQHHGSSTSPPQCVIASLLYRQTVAPYTVWLNQAVFIKSNFCHENRPSMRKALPEWIKRIY